MARSIKGEGITEAQMMQAPAPAVRKGAAGRPAKEQVIRPRRASPVAEPMAGAKTVLRPIPTDCQIINSLARGLKVLTAFGPSDLMLSNKDLAVRTGLPKPTVSRLTATLVKLNFLLQDGATGAYGLGPAALTLGVTASANVDLPHVARPLMQAFAEQYDLSIILGVRDGLEIRGLAYSRGEADADVEVGSHLSLLARQPLGRSASGYALLAEMDPPLRLAMFEQLAEQVGSVNWPNVRRRIEFAIDDINRSGFCASIREWDGTMNAVATPISLTTRDIPMSLFCVQPVASLPESRIRHEVGPALVNLKREILQHYRNQGAA